MPGPAFGPQCLFFLIPMANVPGIVTWPPPAGC
jgi:hypothetical protein